MAAPSSGQPWNMTGGDGTDALSAVAGTADLGSGSDSGFGIDVRLASTKPAALHNTVGWIDFGPGGSSYYYSRTAMVARGSVTLHGESIAVTGTAWFDHQWGDFITVGGGGWDWFAVNLADGTDLTLSLVRDQDGSYPLVYGTLVEPDGTSRHLPRDAFDVAVTKRWTSPTTGADYPAGWRIEVPGEKLVIDLTPTVAGQELDTRATTGVIYWEGSQQVAATRAGQPLGGEGYVELTGYAAGVK
jgi:predicted secreted hydrolase